MSLPTGTTSPGRNARIASSACCLRPPSGIGRSAATTSNGPSNRISTRASCWDEEPACKGFSSRSKRPASELCDNAPHERFTSRSGAGYRRGSCRSRCVRGARDRTRRQWRSRFRRYFDDSHTWGAIFTTPARGGSARQLTHPARGVLDNVPDWSPDGARIAFQRVDPNGCGPGCETDDIDVVTSDGKTLTRVAYDPADKGCYSHGHGAGGLCRNAPGWSPDGKRIAFTCESQPKGQRTCVVERRRKRIARAGADPGRGRGGRLAAVVTRRQPARRPATARKPPCGLHHRRRRRESASSDALVSPRRRAGLGPEWKANRLHVQRGRPSERLGEPLHSPSRRERRRAADARTRRTRAVLSASFSPDGKWLTVSRTPGSGTKGNADVYVMHADGTGLERR